MRARTLPLLVAAALTLPAAGSAAGGLQAQMGDMRPQDREAGAGICHLLSFQPVIVPVSADLAATDAADSPYLRIYDRPRRHELVIDVGPVDLPSHGMAEHSRELVYQLTHFPFEAWVHGFRAEITDAQGRPVPRRVLHHIDTTRPAARDLFLPVAQRFVALGAETKAERLPPWLVGVPIHRGEPLLVSLMLHNPTNTSYAGVRVRLLLSYTRSRPLREVTGFRLDVMFPTGPMEFDLPPGRTVRAWEGSPRVAARLLGITGHLHKYGEWIAVEDLTTHQVIWRARPSTDERGDVRSMPVSFLRFGLGQLVYPTHRYRITASYLNPTARTIAEGGMAKVAGIYTPMEPLPRVEVREALYQDDLRYLLGLRCGHEGMMAMLAHVQDRE